LLPRSNERLIYTRTDCRADDDNAIAVRVKTSLGGAFSTESIVAGGSESIDVVAGIHTYDPYISFRSIGKQQLEGILRGYRDYTLVAKLMLELWRKRSLITINYSSWRPFIEKTPSYQLLGVSARDTGRGFTEDTGGFGDKYAFIARGISSRVPDAPLIGFSTRKGPRERNEDSMLVAQIAVCRSGVRDVVRVGIVCDGAGGLKNGLEASTIGVLETFAKFLDSFTTSNDIAGSMREAVVHANEKIISYVKSIQRQAASTIAMVVIHQNRVYYLNIGDTAIDIVPVESGEPVRLSRHHRVEMQGRTLLSSYLGHPSPEINMGVRELKGETYIVVSTDGVHDILKNHMGEIVLGSKLPSKAADKLTQEAERLGSRDNMTVIVAYARE